MILGRIVGKLTTTHFTFLVEGDAKKFEYVQVMHPSYGYVLCQIVELVRDGESVVAHCNIIGYKDENNHLKPLREPFLPNSEVLRAEDKFIEETVMLNTDKPGAYIGMLEGKNIKVKLDLQKLLTKHVAILAKTGAGKSYTTGVLIEEIIEHSIPLLVIDPHGEYSTLKHPNSDEKELELMHKYGVKPKGYLKAIEEYGNPSINPNLKPIRVSNVLSTRELLHLLPAKLTSTQKSLIYSALERIDEVNFTNLLFEIEKDESTSKFPVVNVIKYLMNLEIFSSHPTPLNELIRPGRCSIINLKGFNPELQEIIVYKLLKDLFEKRKKGFVPPFFLVIEEAHNFCPERNYREAKSSDIIRAIASEGRKFGLGVCIISQRPARVDNNVLSQCNTQIILKVTNPSDIRAIAKSVEGITKEAEDEIKNLPIGTAMVTGVVDTPLFVNIRPRRTLHGGSTATMIEELEQTKKFSGRANYSPQNVLPMIKPKLTKKDIQLMSDKPIVRIETILVPCVMAFCKGKVDFRLVLELINGNVVTDTTRMTIAALPDLSKLTMNELRVLKECYKLKEFKPDDIRHPQITRIHNYLELLRSKGYLVKVGDRYSLNKGIILSDLSNYANYDSITLMRVAYDKKLKPKITMAQIKQKLSNFVRVEELRECYIVHYKVTHKLA
ncbi:ATPase [Candidatus Woesearchaeota archaeon]|nr:ATP-binding protein [Candidatus Woesearchaeota archaeon]RLE42521.1 MAG: ATPase [Candidatus Woesearchaeota archaeon]